MLNLSIMKNNDKLRWLTMYLNRNEKSRYVIVPQAENSSALYAGEQLKKYIEQCVGVLIDISFSDNVETLYKIYIGGQRYHGDDAKDINSFNLNGDGFVLRVTESHVYLDAQNGRGLIYGVYRFLEKFLSVRFFNAECERVPKVNELNVLPCVVIESPVFPLRSYLNGEMWELGGKNIDLYLKYKQNNEHIVISDKKYGGRCSMYGRNGTHNMASYVPYEKYKDTHPEFYEVGTNPFTGEYGYCTIDLLNGITEDGEIDESMDVSVFKIVLEELKKDVLANPDISYFQFEQEDGDIFKLYEEGFWQSKILEKYGRTGILIRFCNLLARTIQEWSNQTLDGRKIYVETFAYAYTKDPPIKEVDGKLVPIDNSVVVADNVVIRLAMGSSFVNYGYHYFHPKNQRFLDRVQGWKVVCNKFMVWCYDMDDVTHLWYYPAIKNIRRNVENFKKLGAVYLMFEAGCSSCRDWQTDLRGYIYSSLMWNSTQSVNQLFNEYMDCVFGVASDEIKKIVMILENFSNYVRSIYDDYYVSTTHGSYRHANTQSEGLLDRLLSVYNDAERKVNELAEPERAIFFKRIQAVKVTLLHMKINKLNFEFYKSVEQSGTVQFSGQEAIPKNKGQTIYNVEIEWIPSAKPVIPEEVTKKINALDPMSISDYINFDKA